MSPHVPIRSMSARSPMIIPRTELAYAWRMQAPSLLESSSCCSASLQVPSLRGIADSRSKRIWRLMQWTATRKAIKGPGRHGLQRIFRQHSTGSAHRSCRAQAIFKLQRCSLLSCRLQLARHLSARLTAVGARPWLAPLPHSALSLLFLPQ